MSQKVQFGGRGTLFWGTDKQLQLSVVDKNQEPIDVTGWTGELVIGLVYHGGGVSALLTKPWSVVGAFSATDNPQVLQVTLTPTDWNSLTKRSNVNTLDIGWRRTNAGFEDFVAHGKMVYEIAPES